MWPLPSATGNEKARLLGGEESASCTAGPPPFHTDNEPWPSPPRSCSTNADVSVGVHVGDVVGYLALRAVGDLDRPGGVRGVGDQGPPSVVLLKSA